MIRRLFGALGLCALVACTVGAQRATGPLRITQFDVGQGDAALIRTPEGRNILIDAGPAKADFVAALRRLGVDTIDLFVASHNHADHIGAAPMVFSAFVVRAYVDNGVPHTTATYRRTLEAVEREPNLVYLRSTNRNIQVGSVSIQILPPPHTRNSQNDNSVGVLVRYGSFRALFTGDAQVNELGAWLEAELVSRVQFLKISHHGASNGTTVVFATVTSPDIAVISVGRNNRYGHPSLLTERRWRARGAKLYRTDIHGNITVEVDSAGLTTVTTSSSLLQFQ